MCVHVCVTEGTRMAECGVEARGQACGIGSFLSLLWGFRDWSPAARLEQQVPLAAEHSCMFLKVAYCHVHKTFTLPISIFQLGCLIHV